MPLTVMLHSYVRTWAMSGSFPGYWYFCYLSDMNVNVRPCNLVFMLRAELLNLGLDWIDKIAVN